jgi:hypothetical protein
MLDLTLISKNFWMARGGNRAFQFSGAATGTNDGGRPIERASKSVVVDGPTCVC